MTNPTTIRAALDYNARNNMCSLHAKLMTEFVASSTDEELVRFAQFIGNLTEGRERMIAPAMDSADLARANID